jgi:BirA family biotin operon repressor/biotin-[acetyl-CoA-carboxylase] ligase
MSVERLSAWEAALTLEGCTVLCVRRCLSTMDIARELAAQPRKDRYALVMTQEQEAGRGRQGRVWIPPRSGFFATFVMPTQKSVQELAGFSLVAGYVVAGVLQGFGCSVGLKWPNDVYSQTNAKLGGILIEIVYLECGVAVLTGIGLNLEGEPKDVNATSVHTLTATSISPVQVASILTPALFDAWEEFERNGFAGFKQRWLRKALYLNQQISIEVGGVRREGIMRGVEEHGLLLLEEHGNVTTIASGEIMNLRPA